MIFVAYTGYRINDTHITIGDLKVILVTYFAFSGTILGNLHAPCLQNVVVKKIKIMIERHIFSRCNCNFIGHGISHRASVHILSEHSVQVFEERSRWWIVYVSCMSEKVQVAI